MMHGHITDVGRVGPTLQSLYGIRNLSDYAHRAKQNLLKDSASIIGAPLGSLRGA